MFSSPSFNSVIVRKSHCRCQFSSLRVNRISLATTQNQVRSTILVIKFSISKFNYLKDRGGNKSYIPASKKVCIIFVSVEPGFHFYTILGLCPANVNSLVRTLAMEVSSQFLKIFVIIKCGFFILGSQLLSKQIE